MEIISKGKALTPSQKKAILADPTFRRVVRGAEADKDGDVIFVSANEISEYCKILEVYIRIGSNHNFHYWAEIGKRGKIYSSKGEVA